jgi:hypothetical protein
LAYAAASAIAFSRVTTGAHFPADGSAHGFVIARYDVLHGQRRKKSGWKYRLNLLKPPRLLSAVVPIVSNCAATSLLAA